MAEEFPGGSFPTAFADSVQSISNSPSVVKFYFARTDPSFDGSGRSVQNPFAQVIMPMDGFAATCLFFQQALANYVRDGFVTEARLAEMRAVLDKAATPK